MFKANLEEGEVEENPVFVKEEDDEYTGVFSNSAGFKEEPNYPVPFSQ